EPAGVHRRDREHHHRRRRQEDRGAHLPPRLRRAELLGRRLRERSPPRDRQAPDHDPDFRAPLHRPSVTPPRHPLKPAPRTPRIGPCPAPLRPEARMGAWNDLTTSFTETHVPLLATALRLATAVLLGLVIGWDRERRSHA